LRPENNIKVLGEFHHSKEGFYEAIKKKGLGLFGGGTQKHKKQSSGATWRMKHILN